MNKEVRKNQNDWFNYLSSDEYQPFKNSKTKKETMKVYAVIKKETMKKFHGSLGITVFKTFEPLYLTEESATMKMYEMIRDLSPNENVKYFIKEYVISEDIHEDGEWTRSQPR